MGRHKKGRGQSGGTHAKDRHMRDRRGNIVDWSQPLPPGLVARPERPKISSKHKSWFEFIENKDKKKKLEIEFTEKREPPPGFEFVPSGNPVLTTKCKELSREQGAMIFIVTSASGVVSRELSWHLNRVGHHIRQSIVEEARKILGDDQLLNIGPTFGHPEPIPESQKEITEQADAAIRDLFPRIPHTDRQAILDHAFNKAKLLQNKGGAPPVGLAADITLTRRVQLAVLAHIRHTHTRYDELLRETSWVIARKAVESLCLDIIVKWRGDEETGRDQLDEILCEVIVISDSESEDSDDDDDDDGEDDDDEDDDDDDNDDDDESANSSLAGEGIGLVSNPPTRSTAPLTTITNLPRGDDLQRAIHAPQKVKKTPRNDRKAAKWGQRGFGRYKAAFDQAWNQALERQRHGHDQVSARSPLELPHHVRQPSYGTSAQQPIFYETGYRPVQHEPPQRIFPETGSRFQAGTPSQHDEPRNGYGAITGTRSYADTEVVRLSHRDVDLRDHLVPSIEPASPTRYPVQRRQSETPFENSTNNVRMVSYRPTMPTSRAVNVQDPSAYRADEGFIRLNSSGMSIVPPESPTSPFPVSQQTYNTTRVYAPEPAYRDSSRLPTYYDDAATPAYRPVVRSQTRPIWVGEDGRVLRSESRPIIIEDSPDRPPRVGPAYPPSGQHHSTERLGDDSVQIVPVSNKFPRRHGLSPIPVDTGVYNPRPDVSQSRYNENLPYSLRQSSAHPQPQRTERVVGLEYLPIRQNYETRTYLERGPLHEAAPIYRSRTASAVTMPYTGPENVAHRYHPDPRRHEVITIID